MTITLIWYVAKKSTKFLALVLNFITIFLAIFLLLSCYNEQNKSTFLASYQFEKHSPFYDTITKSFMQSNRTMGLEKIKVRTGYMGVCIENIPKNYNLNNQQLSSICYPRKNITNVDLYKDIAITMSSAASTKNSSSNKISSDLNILELGSLTSVNVIHPYLLMCTVILIIIEFLLLIYTLLPKAPLRNKFNRVLFIESMIISLIWAMGAIWAHIGVHASFRFIPAASMHIIYVYKGKKAASMSWFIFAFQLVVSIIIGIKEWQARRYEDNDDGISDEEYHVLKHYYNSDSSSYNI